ncbi:MAG: hypothetical protein PSU93_10065 [Methylobacter sp.]|uniref:Uncharacterized protein n=1 Tax=Candidatus Methylobacter titanis TaxID=3053457 RepID=A0AA43Q4A6_9GAMM|nr:hypothetical protein [Candidatus Methylobacter titanis]
MMAAVKIKKRQNSALIEANLLGRWLSHDYFLLLYTPFKIGIIEGNFLRDLMNTTIFNQKILSSLTMLSAINFNAAVIFLLVISVISATGSTLIFDNNSDLYGPLASNLRLMLIYLTLSEFAVYCFCSYRENYRLLILVGLFWLMLMGSIEYYGMINQISIDENYRWFFLYMGISNLAYGYLYGFNKSWYQDNKIDLK